MIERNDDYDRDGFEFIVPLIFLISNMNGIQMKHFIWKRN